MRTLRSILLMNVFVAALTAMCAKVEAQNVDRADTEALEYNVRPGKQTISMYVNSTKIVTLPGKQIPRTLVNDPEVVNVLALSQNQLQLAGMKPGITQINLWDMEKNLYTIELIVFGAAKELELLLRSEFPDAALRVRPLASSVVLSGWVDDPEVISRVVRLAEDFYPKVINNVRVGSNQQVQLHVQVMEVSRTKLRRLGVDWAYFGSTDFVAQSVSGLITETTSNVGSVVGTGGSTLTFGLADDSSNFYAVIDALRQNDLVKVLAEPTLTTLSGRPAAFNSGGEFPILIPQGLGTVAVEYKQFGTRVDFVPIVLGNGNIRLEVRPQVSEVDSGRGVDINGVRVPGLRNRWVDTAVEMRAGQTLALAGLIQERVDAQTRGLPYLADLPWFGSMFRRNTHSVNEIELLVMVRPEFVAAMDPEEVPTFGPGEQSVPPNDEELFMRGYLEVPIQCCVNGDCRICRPGRDEYAVPTSTEQVDRRPQTTYGQVRPGPSNQPFMRLTDQPQKLHSDREAPVSLEVSPLTPEFSIPDSAPDPSPVPVPDLFPSE